MSEDRRGSSEVLEGLSKEEIDDYEDAFKHFDKDNDGFIDSLELATVLRSLGYSPTKEQLTNLMSIVSYLLKARQCFIFDCYSLYIFRLSCGGIRSRGIQVIVLSRPYRITRVGHTWMHVGAKQGIDMFKTTLWSRWN